MKEFCHTFMEDYPKQRNKPNTQRGYHGVIDQWLGPQLAATVRSSGVSWEIGLQRDPSVG